MRRRSWSEKDLHQAVIKSRSIRQVLGFLNLRTTGGNYAQIKKYIDIYKVDTTHLKGRGWNKGLKMPFRPIIPLKDILISNSNYQSYKLKNRLIRVGLKKELCEICGWAQKSVDGRIPLELDHINGKRTDNEIENLRILCPNCHSLQPTHRGKYT